MPRAVRVSINKELLKSVLGLKWHNMTIMYAQIDYSYFGAESLELVLVGEGLPKMFEVIEGQKILKGQLLVHHTEVETEIKPVEVSNG